MCASLKLVRRRVIPVGDSAINRQAVFGLNIPVYPASVYHAQPGIIVDCIYGTGFKFGVPVRIFENSV